MAQIDHQLQTTWTNSLASTSDEFALRNHQHVHAHERSLPYYTLGTTLAAGSRHDGYERVTDVFPSRYVPRFYSARIADVKDDLTLFRPPLRKKAKLTTTSLSPAAPSPGMRRLVGLSKTSSVPSFSSVSLGATPDNDDERPSSSSGVTQSSTHPLHHSYSKTLQRSPAQKRPPASHSSYGVETTLGPPASYSTQRTLSQDRIRLDRSASARNTNSPTREGSPTKNQRDSSPSKSRRDPSPPKLDACTADAEPTTARLSPVKLDVSPSTTGSSSDDPTTQGASSPETADTQSVLTPDSVISKESTMPSQLTRGSQDEKENTELSPLLAPMASEEDNKGSSSDEKKSEDLFLNIARTDASRSGGQPPAKVEKRRSRVSLPFFNTGSRPSTGYKSSPIQDRFDTASVSGRSEAPNYFTKRSSLGQHVPGALSRTFTQDTTIRSGGLETQSSHPADLPRRIMSRRYSNATSTANTNAEPRTVSRPSTARNARLVSDGTTFLDRPRIPEHVETASTVSTTAPSTVWDELDDLKSRIKKLELTGKLPPSSAAAMATSERPKTATTAATTTMSSSPKHKATTVTPLQSAIEGIPSNVHPNLHEALGNAKAVLSNEVYQKLQATAQDAFQLSVMMNPEAHNTAGSTIGLTLTSERLLRRRTESICRSLTELTIAMLADNKHASQPVTRPASRDAYQPLSGLRGRRYSDEPSDRSPVASRVQSRLETRRTRAAVSNTTNLQTTPPESVYQTPPTALLPVPSSSSSRVSRTTSLVRSRRTPGHNVDGTTDDEESSPSMRPVSRAMTEVSSFRQAARDRAAYSREYTAQHPMPQQPTPSTTETKSATKSQLPSHISTHLNPRRRYGNLSASTSNAGTPHDRTPVTPKEPWGRISIVPSFTSSPIEATPESQVSARAPPTRRSLGFTSRISSVSSRLRAAKGDRSAASRDNSEPRGSRDFASSGQILDNVPPLGRQGSGQSLES